MYQIKLFKTSHEYLTLPEKAKIRIYNLWNDSYESNGKYRLCYLFVSEKPFEIYIHTTQILTPAEPEYKCITLQSEEIPLFEKPIGRYYRYLATRYHRHRIPHLINGRRSPSSHRIRNLEMEGVYIPEPEPCQP